MSLIQNQLGPDNSYSFSVHQISGPESIKGELQFETLTEPLEINQPSFCTINEIDSETGTILLQLGAGNKTQGTLVLKIVGDRLPIPLLSAPAYFAVGRVIEGNIEPASKILENYYDRDRHEWDFRADCRKTIQYDPFITVMDRLAGEFEAYETVMYRSATGYFANRIQDEGPQQINSFECLKDRIDQWNESDNLPPISANDALAEYLGHDWIHSHLSNEREHLREIGFEPIQYDPSWDTIVPASWLAHLILTEGEDAARDYIRKRPIPCDTEYSLLKDQASDSSKNRWKDWGDTVAVAGQNAEDNFHYAAYQYLRFAGKDYHENAKINPMLFSAATVLTGPLPDYFHQRIRFQEQISFGHEYRRDKNWKEALNAFQNAEVIASGEIVGSYDFKPQKVAQAKKSLAHAQATISARDRDYEGAIEEYRSTISEIKQVGNRYNIGIDRHVDFLEKQQSKLN